MVQAGSLQVTLHDQLLISAIRVQELQAMGMTTGKAKEVCCFAD